MKKIQIIAVIAVLIIIVAGISAAYVMTRDNSKPTVTLSAYPQAADVSFTWEKQGMDAPVAYTGSITADKGDVLTITATSSNSDFLFWDDMSAGADSEHTRTYSVTGNATLTAFFMPDGNTVTDARGRVVTIPDTINSVFAALPCSLQLVSFFDAVNKVKYLDGTLSAAGGENFDDNDRSHTYIMSDLLSGLPKVDTNNVESVIETHADIIINSTIDVSKLDDFQASVGIPVFAINADLEFNSPAMYYQLYALGKLFGEEQRAAELVNGILSMIGYITDNSSPVIGMTGYACGMNFYTPGSFLRTSGDYLPFIYSGLTNISASSSAGVGAQPYNTNIESVIAANPQIIFIDGQGLDTTVQFIKDNPALQQIDAIKNGQVYKTMVYKDWGTNWVNVLINIYYVASVVHPDLFSQTSFEDYANQIIHLFYPHTDKTYEDLAGAQSGGLCRNVSDML